MSDIVGKLLVGRYRVDAFLGRGGMADVYKVWDEKRAVYLAMKLLRPDLAEDRVFLRRFTREASALQSLQHPNIVRLYGLEQEGEVAFMLMDYVEGETLRTEIFRAQGPLPPLRVLEIMRPICAALYFAHQQGMIHCDVKPANIMIHQNGTVLLTDFGIARLTEAATATLVGAGTPAYMAPEQIRGEEPLPETDVYALGTLLFEMLTGGERPFTGERAESTTSSLSQKVIWEKLSLDAPSPRQYNPHLSPGLEAIVLKCLAREPAQRFHDTMELLAELESEILGEDLATRAAPPPAAQPPPQVSEPVPARDAAPQEGTPPKSITVPLPTRANLRWLWVVFGVAVLAALVIGGRGLFAGGGERPQPSPTPPVVTSTATKVASTPAKLTSTPEKVEVTPTFSPPLLTSALGGGTGEIAFVSSRSGSAQVWLLDVSTGETRQITSRPGGVCQPDWSPDGTRLVVTAPCATTPRESYPDSSLFLLDVAEGTMTPLPAEEGGDYDPAWSPDGSRIAFTSLRENQRPQIYLLELESLQVDLLVSSEKFEQAKQPAWSPDGSRVVFVRVRNAPEELWLVDANGENLQPLSQSGKKWANKFPRWSPDGEWILFSQARASGGVSSLMIFQVSLGINEVRITPEKVPMREGRYSPDGKYVVFEGWPDGVNHDIFLVTLEEGKVERLLEWDSSEFDPVWRPPLVAP